MLVSWRILFGGVFKLDQLVLASVMETNSRARV